MQFIFDEGNQNIAGFTAPGGYVQLMNAPIQAGNNPSNAIAFLGTGSFGPVNKPMGPFGDIASAAFALGQFNVTAWQSDPYDVMRSVTQALGEAQNPGSLNIWVGRISDGTDAPAQLVLVDITSGTPLTGMTIPVKWTGVGGNTIKCTISAGGITNSFNVVFSGTWSGQSYSESYPNIQGSASGPSTFWANLKTAIENGTQSGPPSQILGSITLGSNSALNPAVGTFSFSGGTDGRSGVTSSTFFGSDVPGNRQGIYAMRGLPIVPSFIYCSGLTDSTKFPNLQAFITSEIMRTVVPVPTGTATLAAVGLRGTNGISDKRFCYAKDYVYWTDPISGQTIFTDPVPIMIARAASLSPEMSVINEQVYTVVSTEHPEPYPADEIGLLQSNGFWVITNPCPGGQYWGIGAASTTASNPVQQPVEYSRLQDYIGILFASVMGQFVGKKQGPTDPDPTRAACKNAIDAKMSQLAAASIIVSFSSEVDSTLNPAASVQAGFMTGNLDYTPYSNIKFSILNLSVSSALSAAQAYAQNPASQQ